MLASYLGLPRQSEILIIIFLGICFLSLDFSLFHIRTNLEEVWKIKLEKAKYLETALKYVISAVVLVRTFTLHAFLAFYIVMLWPAIFEEKPNLMLPWLLLGILRCLIVNGATFMVGTFICQKEKGLSPICFEYMLAQIIEHGPSVYAWMAVLSFYRELADEHGSQQSSLETLCSEDASIEVLDSREAAVDSEDGFEKKSYSLSDLHCDYLYSSRAKSLPGDGQIETLIMELRDLFAKKRIMRDGSKSFDSLAQEEKQQAHRSPSSVLTVAERTMEKLKISSEDIQKAKEKQGRFVQVLKEISTDEVVLMGDIVTIKSSSSKNKLSKGTKVHMPKSHSQNEDLKNRETCLCYLRKQLKLEQSNQTLFESEIANITLNEGEPLQKNETCCSANKSKKTFLSEIIIRKMDNDLNRYRVVAGSRSGFNPNVFLQKFVLKRNTSKNFGCQVSTLRRGFFEESRNQMAKKLVFLRNFGLS